MFVSLPLGNRSQSGVWHQIHHRGEWRERQLVCFICKCVLHYIPSACALSQPGPSFPLSVLFVFDLHLRMHLLLYVAFVVRICSSSCSTRTISVFVHLLWMFGNVLILKTSHSTLCKFAIVTEAVHFISKALMTGVALMAANVHFQMCLFPPYMHIFYCCHGYCFHLSIHPFWQGFKGICSLLVNVIKGCWSVMQIVRLLSWEFSQFLSRNRFISFSAQDEGLYLSNCCSVKWNLVSSNLLLLFWDNEKLPDTVE